MLRCIIFDMDDTILKLKVDWHGLTNEINWEYFGGKYSHLPPDKFFVAYFKRLLNKLTKRQIAEVRKKRLDLEMSGVATGRCFPYRHIIAQLKKTYKLGVVSGNYRPSVKKALTKCGLTRYFGAVVSMDDCNQPKPSPAPLLKALRKLRRKPSESVYVGNHPDDIRAGRSAGMKTIGVAATSAAKAKLKGARPNVIIKNIGELPVALKKLRI